MREWKSEGSKEETTSTELNIHNLVSAILIVEHGVSRDAEYWNLRIELLLRELGFLSQDMDDGMNLLSGLSLMRSELKKWSLPYEGAMEVPSSPDFYAQQWLSKNYAPRIEFIKTEILALHQHLFEAFFQMWAQKLGLESKTTTLGKLIELGLPESEPTYDPTQD